MKKPALASGTVMLVAVVVGALVCSGCGSGKSTSSGTSVSAPAAKASASGLRGTVVKVGLIDPVNGDDPFPQVAVGAKAGLEYVNDTLHGIGGHPVDLVTCDTDGTPQTNVNCANTFVQDHVSFVVDGFDLSSGSELPILNSAKIPLVGSVAENPVANASTTSFYYGPAGEAFSVGPLYTESKAGVRSVAFAAPNDPTNQAYFNADIIPVAKRLGMKVSVSYYSTSAGVNWPVVAQTLISKQAQLAGLADGSEGNCTSLLEALESGGYKGTVILGGCSQFVQTVGAAKAKGVLSYTGNWVPEMSAYAPTAIQAELRTYASEMAGLGGTSDENSEFASGVYSALTTTVEALDDAHVSVPLVGTTVTTTLRALKAFPVVLGPDATCDGQQWPNTSSCIDSILMTRIAANGDVAPLTDPAFEPLDVKLLPAA